MSSNRLKQIIIHLLLAVFLANAANKFFVSDLEYEEQHHFYARIFKYHGDAPDQYRILPLLGLKVLCGSMRFNWAVLVYNCILSFVLFELFARLMKGQNERRIFSFNFLFAAFYIYTQYTGWRPDTMGLMVICAFTAMIPLLKPAGVTRDVLLSVCIVALAFSRAEIALIFGIFFAFFATRSLLFRLLWLVLPLVIQVSLQKLIFPDAVYYSKPVMLSDNFSLFYILRNPSTWLILAAIAGTWSSISSFVSSTFRTYLYFYVLIAAYLVFVLVVGRVNEYRLYLPFLPLLLLIIQDVSRKPKVKSARS